MPSQSSVIQIFCVVFSWIRFLYESADSEWLSYDNPPAEIDWSYTFRLGIVEFEMIFVTLLADDGLKPEEIKNIWKTNSLVLCNLNAEQQLCLAAAGKSPSGMSKVATIGPPTG